MFRLRILILLLAVCAHAKADSVWAEWHGNTKPEDYSHLVTEKFLQRFPSERWALFVNSTAFSLGQQFVCFASVGVAPRGLHQFPAHVYEGAKSRATREADLLIGEQRAFEAECVRLAIKNMLSDNIENVYRPYPVEGQ